MPAEFKDEDKQLQDNLYSFTVRKMVAQHHIHFVDFKTAERHLRNIFEDELDYYGIRIGEKEKEEEKEEAPAAPASIDPAKATEPAKKPEFKPIDLGKIDMACQDKPEFIDCDEYRYSPKSHPLYRIAQTLLMLAEVFAAKAHSEEAFKLYDFISSCYFKLFGTNDTILNSYV